MEKVNRPLYVELAVLVQAYLNCAESENDQWMDRHELHIKDLCDEHMPHGSGFDRGVWPELTESNAKKLVFYVDYHAMNPDGFYSGWLEHRLTVTPTFGGFSMDWEWLNRLEWAERDIEVDDSPSNRWYSNDQHEEYASQVFDEALRQNV